MKIAIAMSGGVDSSVAAKILKDKGHNVVGLFLKLWSDSSSVCSIEKQNRCCDYEALDDARAVASKLGIPFYVINARDEFKKEVVDYFLSEYKNLRTPNPCVVCNDKIKFGLLLKRAMEIGCDFLATGHYARVAEITNHKSQITNKFQNPNSKIRNPNESNPASKANEAVTYKLLTSVDETKDQSYMLYHLNQKQLAHVMFPLGEMKKIDVRKLAEKWDLPVKEKPESQEICFFGDKDYRSFLKRYLPEKYFKPGEIVDQKGNVLGEHQGLINYTIGQRKGVEQTNNSKLIVNNHNLKLKTVCHSEQSEESHNKIPLYAVGFDIKKNQLIVGEDKEVYSKEMIVSDVNWVSTSFDCHAELVSTSLKVKIRYRHEAVPCQITNKSQNKKSKTCHCPKGGPSGRESATRQSIDNVRVVFGKAQRAVTPGQSAVFYEGDEVLGGGIIR